VDQHELAAQRGGSQRAGLDRAEPGIAAAVAGEQHDIGLAQA
jgi:methyl coenzyme M reductase alpha subunit